jgi:TRADD-N domain-containing protein
MPFEILLKALTGLLEPAIATMAAAFAANHFLSLRKTKEKQGPTEDIAAIAETVRSEREGRKAAVAEVLATQAMGENPTPERFREIVQTVMFQLDRATDTVSKSVEQLINNYHEQALNQAKVQFWFSVIAATIGFIWILYAGVGIQADKLATVSKTVPGIVMDAVAFLFFKQAAETRQRATELYDRLRRDKQMAESSSLVASIEDVRLRSAVKAQLALHMSGLQPNAIDLGAFLTTPSPVETRGPNPQKPPSLTGSEGASQPTG